MDSRGSQRPPLFVMLSFVAIAFLTSWKLADIAIWIYKHAHCSWSLNP